MITNFNNLGGGSGSGSTPYVLPVATANVLGGVKIGSGLTIDSGGTLSSEGGAAAEAFTITLSAMDPEIYTQADLAAMQSMVDYLSGYTLDSLPVARIAYEGWYYTLIAGWDESDGESVEWRNYEFSYAGASGQYGEDERSPFIDDFLLNGNDVSESYDRYWEPSESGDGPRVILLNNLSKSELVDLYDEITAMYDYEEMAFTSDFHASDYAFYLDLTDSVKQSEIGVGDRNYEGWFPMVLNYVNPSDYDGGAIYFTGVEGRQDGNGYLYNIRFIVTNQGETEANAWVVEPPQPDYQQAIIIDSGGTIVNPSSCSIFSSENFNHKVIFKWEKGNDEPDWGQAPLKYVYRDLDGDDNLVYHFAVDNLCIDGVKYRGIWHVVENDWESYVTDLWEEVQEGEGAWIAVLSGGTIDSAHSIYNKFEFAKAVYENKLDKFPIRHYVEDGSGHTYWEYGTIQAIHAIGITTIDGVDYPKMAFKAYIAFGEKLCSYKAYVIVSYNSGTGEVIYNWDNYDWTEADDLRDPQA